MNCSKRIIEIISALLERDDYVTVSEIADQLGISKRTIFREMDTLEVFIQSLGMKLEKKTRIGIKLFADESQIKKFKEIADKCDNTGLDQEDRQNKLISELLKSREPKKFYHFSKLLGVSEATISYDMDKIEPWFDGRGIKLVRKPGYGVYLEGTEKQYRKAIVDFLYQNYEHQELLGIFNNQDSMMNDVLDRNTLVQIGAILLEFGSLLIEKLTENAHMGLTIHLTIAVQRIKRGESIIMKTDLLNELKEDDLFKLAGKIGAKIESHFGIRFPDDEIGYITMHLKGSKLKSGSLVEADGMLISNFEITRLASNMIQKFGAQSGYSLANDDQLLVGLVSHLRPAISRIKMALEIRNPLLEKIKEMYPEIFSMSRVVSTVIEEKYDIELPDGEIGYIAMHFGASIERFKKHLIKTRKIKVGVVCASGIGTSSLLYSRLEKSFPDMELVTQLSKEDILTSRAQVLGIELLISTIVIEASGLPVIQVNPLLPESDIEKVKKVIPFLSSKPAHTSKQVFVDDTEKIKKIRDITEAILSIEENFEMIILDHVSNIKSLIKMIASHHTDGLKNTIQLQKELINREKLGSTLIHGEKTMLVHTKTATVSKPKLSIWRLRKPLIHDSGEEVVLVIVMIIPEQASKVYLDLMSRVSKSLIEESSFIELLRS
ncbi:MAG TPA: hypothetical protein DCS67_08580, partial [Clostridiales bacterium UBA8960]|nr:hypothetical protein [Clostridiales bacterium UBA8960]